MNPLLILVGTQLLFTASDLLARHYMHLGGFTLANFLSPWFAGYFSLRILAMFGQLYVFTHLELGKTMALFAVVSIILANLLGFLLLGEVLTMREYVGVAFAILAFFALAFLR